MLNLEILNALPASYEPHTLYLIASAGDAQLVQIYMSNASGTAVRHVIDRADIMAMISTSMASLSSIRIVPTLPARNALVLTANTFVMVLDASLDPTVTNGAALYLWDATQSAWSKVAEYESLDVSLRWSAILDGPASSVTQIDASVAASHQHQNRSVLDQLSEDDQGRLMYRGQYITPGLALAQW